MGTKAPETKAPHTDVKVSAEDRDQQPPSPEQITASHHHLGEVDMSDAQNQIETLIKLLQQQQQQPTQLPPPQQQPQFPFGATPSGSAASAASATAFHAGFPYATAVLARFPDGVATKSATLPSHHITAAAARTAPVHAGSMEVWQLSPAVQSERFSSIEGQFISLREFEQRAEKDDRHAV